MTILITGGAGYIGSHTVVQLINAGYECVLVDNLSNTIAMQVKTIEQITGKKITSYQFDLLNQAGLKQVFESHSISAVIHFAGKKSVVESIENPLYYYENNVTGTLNLIQLMKEFEVKNFIFSSTANVYGNNVSPLSEEMSLGTTNPYGRTKLMIEEILMDLVKADSSWSVAILRYFNPIGYHSSGLLGEVMNKSTTNLMPSILRAANDEIGKLLIYGNDYSTIDGTAIRDFIHIDDLATGHIKALDYVMQNNGIEAFNLGSGNGFTVKQLVDTFQQVTGCNVPYEIIQRRIGDIGISFANTSKAKRELNWEPQCSLEQMCNDSWNWYKKRGVL